MTEPADIDALVADARTDISDARRCESLHITPATGTILRALVKVTDALESTLGELRQERTARAEDRNEMVADAERLIEALSHAEETIEKARNLPRHELNALITAVDAHDIDAILTEYGKQKEN